MMLPWESGSRWVPGWTEVQWLELAPGFVVRSARCYSRKARDTELPSIKSTVFYEKQLCSMSS